MFQRFDLVKYTGHKLSGEIANKVGEIVCKMKTGGYVVDFGSEAYVVDDANLVRHNHSEGGPQVVRRRKYDDED